MSRKLYSYGPEELTETINQAVDILLDTLIKKEYASEEAKNYKIIVHEKGFFGKYFSEFFNKKEDALKITIVKIV